MSDQYRAASMRCPFCGGRMEERATDAAAVDVCVECRGVWIDWFDGEISAVARSLDQRPGKPAGGVGEQSCPRCADKLVAELHHDHGPPILRCPGCAGVCVAAGSLAEIVAMGPPPDASDAAPSLGERILEVLRRLLPGAT